MTDFYQTDRWRELRRIVLDLYGSTCMACNVEPNETGKPPHVDHILARARFPTYELAIHNLQVLCEQCNCSIKGTDVIDYRTKSHIQTLRKSFNRTPQPILNLLEQHGQEVVCRKRHPSKHERQTFEQERRQRLKKARIAKQKRNTFNKEKHDRIQAKQLAAAEQRSQHNKIEVEKALKRANGLRTNTKQPSATIKYKKRRTVAA